MIVILYFSKLVITVLYLIASNGCKFACMCMTWYFQIFFSNMEDFVKF